MRLTRTLLLLLDSNPFYLLDSGLSTVAAYAVRKLGPAYSGQCLRLRRSTDNAESDFGFSDNDLDVAAIATFIGAGSGFVKTWYDQSGNGYDLTQTTTANQPQLVLAVLNNKPILRFDGSNDVLSNTSFPDFGDNYSTYCVAKYASGGDATQGIFDVSNGSLNTGFGMYHEATAKFNSRGAPGVSLADSTADLRDGTWRIHDGCNTGTQIQYRRNDGTAQVGAYTAPNPNTLNRLDVGKFGQLAGYIFNGDLPELVIASITHSSGTRASVINNQNTYYAVY